MSTTRGDIQAWLDEGLNMTPPPAFMVVAVDEFDWSDFPVYVMPDEDVDEIVKEYQDKPLSRVMEVYSFLMPLKPQLDKKRSWNTTHIVEETP